MNAHDNDPTGIDAVAAYLKERHRFFGALVLVWLFSLIFLGGLLYLAPPSVGADGEDFLALVHTLQEHGRFAVSEDAPPMYDRVPLYPLFAALCSALPGPGSELQKIVFGQVLLLAAAAVAVAALAGVVLDPKWSIVAGLIFITYRGHVFTTAIITRESLAILLFYSGLLCVCAGLRIASARTKRMLAVGGLVFGLGALCREELAGYAVIVGLYIVASQAPSRTAALRRTAVFFVAVFVALSPWMIRNYATANRILPLSTAFGTEFYAGNNHGAIAHGINYGQAPVLRTTSDLDAFEVNRKYRQLAIAFIMENPARAARHAISKMKIYGLPNSREMFGAYLFLIPLGLIVFYLAGRGGQPNAGAVSMIIVAAAALGLVMLGSLSPLFLLRATGSYTVLLVMGAIGLVIAVVRSPRRNWIFPALYIAGIVLAGIVIPQNRLRIVLDAGLCIGACFVLDAVCTRIGRMNRI